MLLGLGQGRYKRIAPSPDLTWDEVDSCVFPSRPAVLCVPFSLRVQALPQMECPDGLRRPFHAVRC